MEIETGPMRKRNLQREQSRLVCAKLQAKKTNRRRGKKRIFWLEAEQRNFRDFFGKLQEE